MTRGTKALKIFNENMTLKHFDKNVCPKLHIYFSTNVVKSINANYC